MTDRIITINLLCDMKYKKVIIALVIITIVVCIYLLSKPSQKKLVRKTLQLLSYALSPSLVFLPIIKIGRNISLTLFLTVYSSCTLSHSIKPPGLLSLYFASAFMPCLISAQYPLLLLRLSLLLSR